MATIDTHVTRNLIALDGATSCGQAARVMKDQNVGSVAVRDGGRVVGVVTERDLVTRVLAEGARPELAIRDAMRTDLPRVTPRTTELEATRLMRDHVTRHLLVAEGDEVVGIISMRDVIRLMLQEKEWLVAQLQSFIDGHDGPHAALA
jgi:signal-transduction protein with cAMP-binding, CBS, and nucleotidyltransferase domain